MGPSDGVFFQQMDAAGSEEPLNQKDEAITANQTVERSSSHSDISHYFLVVPEILSKELRSRVFNADPSGDLKHEFEDSAADATPAKENLEHLGDSVLRLFVTGLILDMYPGLRAGPSTKLREMLMDNALLSDMGLFVDNHTQAARHVQFKIFVGALYLDQGLESVKPWLATIFHPYSSKAYNLLRDEHGSSRQGSPALSSTPSSPPLPSTSPGSPASPLALLNECAQKGNRHVEWAYANHPSAGIEAGSSGGAQQSSSRESGKTKTTMWVAEVLVDGEVFGRGEGNTKKAARSEAAKQALPRLGVSV
ncbi:hypothetical protein DFH06DRAFT_372853 [Mycena polygramma]|nr:hypothetical protein DFH06DRAFT_372853 [Mycena polygramma]